MMSYKVKDAVGNIYIIKASNEKEAIKKYRTIRDAKFVGSDGTVDFYEYDNGYYVGGKRIADKKVKDYGTQRRQFRSSDIDEEGSWLGTTEWGTPKGSMYVYKKGNKIIAECQGVAYGDPKGIFEFDNLNQFNKWLLNDQTYDSKPTEPKVKDADDDFYNKSDLSSLERAHENIMKAEDIIGKIKDKFPATINDKINDEFVIIKKLDKNLSEIINLIKKL